MKTTTFLLLFLFALSAKAQTTCPIYGDKNVTKFRNLDQLKNRNTPGASIDRSVTLQSILTPGNDTTRFNSNQYVTLTGYVILVKAGGPETCECHSKDPNDLDVHIELALNPTDKNAQAMVVEINRYTKADHPEFTVAHLKHLVGKKVSITGWLFFDEEHLQNAVTTNPSGTHHWRYTCWEVHPVLKVTPLQL
jgi:hypothetical protein